MSTLTKQYSYTDLHQTISILKSTKIGQYIDAKYLLKDNIKVSPKYMKYANQFHIIVKPNYSHDNPQLRPDVFIQPDSYTTNISIFYIELLMHILCSYGYNVEMNNILLKVFEYPTDQHQSWTDINMILNHYTFSNPEKLYYYDSDKYSYFMLCLATVKDRVFEITTNSYNLGIINEIPFNLHLIEYYSIIPYIYQLNSMIWLDAAELGFSHIHQYGEYIVNPFQSTTFKKVENSYYLDLKKALQLIEEINIFIKSRFTEIIDFNRDSKCDTIALNNFIIRNIHIINRNVLQTVDIQQRHLNYTTLMQNEHVYNLNYESLNILDTKDCLNCLKRDSKEYLKTIIDQRNNEQNMGV